MKYLDVIVDSYFYPRPPRGGRLFVGCIKGQAKQISIHALREEGDHTITERWICHG